MIYLTYEEYSEMGGVLDSTAFIRNIDRACGIIDTETHDRIQAMEQVPTQVKSLCRDLVEYLNSSSSNERIVSSRSQSAGAVSESESYATKSSADVYIDIDNLVCDYLLNVKDDKGTPLLYRGGTV